MKGFQDLPFQETLKKEGAAKLITDNKPCSPEADRKMEFRGARRSVGETAVKGRGPEGSWAQEPPCGLEREGERKGEMGSEFAPGSRDTGLRGHRAPGDTPAAPFLQLTVGTQAFVCFCSLSLKPLFKIVFCVSSNT